MKKLDIFEIVYIAISIATFQHTLFSAATVFEGPMPSELFKAIWWIFNGALIAIAIDVGMFFSARSFAETRSKAMFAAFFLAAVGSMYTQIMYAVMHTQNIELGQGVTDYWQGVLQPIVDARVVIFPAMLPGYSVIYTIARLKQKTREIEELPKPVELKQQDQTPVATAIEEKKQEVLPEPQQEMLALPEPVAVSEEQVVMSIQYKAKCSVCNKILGPYGNEQLRSRAVSLHLSRAHKGLTDKSVIDLYILEGNEQVKV